MCFFPIIVSSMNKADVLFSEDKREHCMTFIHKPVIVISAL